ncbi:L-asparaginase II [Synechococcus sp. PCC 7502]|uniref:asparaginase n=1 Tax=Synechococcus sp. PCC 7502 TaxID=1173263 RepID=UPI00029FE455|nr:asparaginase [Synechococcus sp. PCC 7502]AFY72813.1 L-asparaginase II [Synechococcus sp. PCC 7502]
MNLSKVARSNSLTVRLLREGILESVHECEAAVSDAKGRILSMAGSSQTATFVRSALKPIQAIAVSATGAQDRFNLSESDLAIICGSHQGTVSQARQVFNILWRCDVEPSALQCPIPQGGTSPLQYNCSGKHAGMIAVCQQQGLPLSFYMSPSHPVQELILRTLSELLRMPAAEFISVHDDCGVPTYLLEIGQMAYLYAQLASHSQLHLERITRAMTRHPEMVSGAGQFDTELMRLTNGEIVSKSGAEGVQCLGRVGEGLGLAIKVMDGAKRAKHAVAIHLLRQLGWISPVVAESLEDSFTVIGRYNRLEVVGELSYL